MARPVKREPGTSVPEEAHGDGVHEAGSQGGGGGDTREGVTERRALRSRYLAVKSLITDERDDISRADSGRFKSIISEVETLHQQGKIREIFFPLPCSLSSRGYDLVHLSTGAFGILLVPVQKPREQVADAEALLDIANTLVASVRSHSNDGLTPSDFIAALLQTFGQQEGTSAVGAANVRWRDVGLAVSHLFRRGPGCCTMLGPMNTELKQRKTVVHRKRTRPTESARPEELQSTDKEGRTDTDKNMSTMFDILRRNRRVRLENLVLNRVSFAQTIENIFAMSFLIKDGRAEITVDDKGNHLVSPRNAPAASAVASGEVSYHHFVFRFDFKDWKLMMNVVGAGEELMPHRSGPSTCGASEVEPHCDDSQSAPPTTPIRKLTRNRGLVIQERSVMEESPEHDASGNEEPARKKGKCLSYG